jgi:dephospho-CoA kinase
VFVAGLTGGIGSGKSTVSALLASLGAVVIDADIIARQVVEPGTPALTALVERFGAGILDSEGRLDRPALAAIAFASPESVADLNAITHPAVGAEIARRLEDLADTDDVVVLDVPLLVEGGRYPLGLLVVVDCPEEVAVRRLVEERGMDEADVRRRMAAQASRAERLAAADVVIDNSGDLADLEPQVAALWRTLTTR